MERNKADMCMMMMIHIDGVEIQKLFAHQPRQYHGGARVCVATRARSHFAPVLICVCMYVCMYVCTSILSHALAITRGVSTAKDYAGKPSPRGRKGKCPQGRRCARFDRLLDPLAYTQGAAGRCAVHPAYAYAMEYGTLLPREWTPRDVPPKLPSLL